MARISDNIVSEVDAVTQGTADQIFLKMQTAPNAFTTNFIFGNDGAGGGNYTNKTGIFQPTRAGRLHGIICTLGDIAGFSLGSPITFGSSSTIGSRIRLQGGSFPPTGVYPWKIPNLEASTVTGTLNMIGNNDYFMNFPEVISSVVLGNQAIIKLGVDFEKHYSIEGGIPMTSGDTLSVEFPLPTFLNPFLTNHSYQVLFTYDD
jgi:hypothetical protein